MQGSPSAEYFGHVITAKGVAVDPSKIECIKHWPKPGLRGFLGYYRKFVRNFGIIAKRNVEERLNGHQNLRKLLRC